MATSFQNVLDHICSISDTEARKVLAISEHTCLVGLPPECHKYEVNGRTSGDTACYPPSYVLASCRCRTRTQKADE